MKISELINILQNRLNSHGDIETKITWEGICCEINSNNIYKNKEDDLYIDADNNFYKSEFASDETEGENGK